MSGTRARAYHAALDRQADVFRAILDAVTEHGPLTPDEIAELTGIDKMTIRPACTHLKDHQQLRDSDFTGTNASGFEATKVELNKGPRRQMELFK